MSSFLWVLGILLGGLAVVGAIATFSRTKPQDGDEGGKYPFDERDIYSNRQNGQDKHHKKAS